MRIDLVIEQLMFSGGYQITMRGHYPNELFRSVVANDFPDYPSAWKALWDLDNACRLLGNDVYLYNTPPAAVEGDAYCDKMAFTCLPVLENYA